MLHKIEPRAFVIDDKNLLHRYTFKAKSTSTVIIEHPDGLRVSGVEGEKLGYDGRYQGLPLFSITKDRFEIKVEKGRMYSVLYSGFIDSPKVYCIGERKIRKVDAFKLFNPHLFGNLCFTFTNTDDLHLQNIAFILVCNNHPTTIQPTSIEYNRAGQLIVRYSQQPGGHYKLRIIQSDDNSDQTLDCGDGLLISKNHIVKQALHNGFNLKHLHNGHYGLHDYVFDFAATMAREFRQDDDE